MLPVDSYSTQMASHEKKPLYFQKSEQGLAEKVQKKTQLRLLGLMLPACLEWQELRSLQIYLFVCFVFFFLFKICQTYLFWGKMVLLTLYISGSSRKWRFHFYKLDHSSLNQHISQASWTLVTDPPQRHTWVPKSTSKQCIQVHPQTGCSPRQGFPSPNMSPPQWLIQSCSKAPLFLPLRISGFESADKVNGRFRFQ